MSIKEMMDAIHKHDEVTTLQRQVAGLKQIISCAMCGECGERIGDEDFDLSEEEVLVHTRCLDEEEEV